MFIDSSGNNTPDVIVAWMDHFTMFISGRSAKKVALENSVSAVFTTGLKLATGIRELLLSIDACRRTTNNVEFTLPCIVLSRDLKHFESGMALKSQINAKTTIRKILNVIFVCSIFCTTYELKNVPPFLGIWSYLHCVNLTVITLKYNDY